MRAPTARKMDFADGSEDFRKARSAQSEIPGKPAHQNMKPKSA
jgi:hypothetical protein